jgi:hypothetical protein
VFGLLRKRSPLSISRLQAGNNSVHARDPHATMCNSFGFDREVGPADPQAATSVVLNGHGRAAKEMPA